MEVVKEEGRIFTTDLNKEQCAGTGMAMILILLLLGLYNQSFLYFQIAIPVLLINMTVPKVYYPLAVVWFGLATIMGMIMSKVVLTLIFVLMVVPLGLLRRLRGHDAMKLKGWKKGRASVFNDRNKTFSSTDLIHPY